MILINYFLVSGNFGSQQGLCKVLVLDFRSINKVDCDMHLLSSSLQNGDETAHISEAHI